MRSCVHLPTRLSSELVSSLELVFQLDQTAGNTACNRPGGQLQRLADRAVALVPREEAVENLAAVFRQADHRIVHVERLVEPREDVLIGVRGQLTLLGCLLPRACADAV